MSITNDQQLLTECIICLHETHAPITVDVDETVCSNECRIIWQSRRPIAATDFDAEWEHAPRPMRNYVERSIAEYWFMRGRHIGRADGLAQTNADFRQMIEAARERIR